MASECTGLKCPLVPEWTAALACKTLAAGEVYNHHYTQHSRGFPRRPSSRGAGENDHKYPPMAPAPYWTLPLKDLAFPLFGLPTSLLWAAAEPEGRLQLGEERVA